MHSREPLPYSLRKVAVFSVESGSRGVVLAEGASSSLVKSELMPAASIG